MIYFLLKLKSLFQSLYRFFLSVIFIMRPRVRVSISFYTTWMKKRYTQNSIITAALINPFLLMNETSQDLATHDLFHYVCDTITSLIVAGNSFSQIQEILANNYGWAISALVLHRIARNLVKDHTISDTMYETLANIPDQQLYYTMKANTTTIYEDIPFPSVSTLKVAADLPSTDLSVLSLMGLVILGSCVVISIPIYYYIYFYTKPADVLQKTGNPQETPTPAPELSNILSENVMQPISPIEITSSTDIIYFAPMEYLDYEVLMAIVRSAFLWQNLCLLFLLSYISLNYLIFNISWFNKAKYLLLSLYNKLFKMKNHLKGGIVTTTMIDPFIILREDPTVAGAQLLTQKAVELIQEYILDGNTFSQIQDLLATDYSWAISAVIIHTVAEDLIMKGLLDLTVYDLLANIPNQPLFYSLKVMIGSMSPVSTSTLEISPAISDTGITYTDILLIVGCVAFVAIGLFTVGFICYHLYKIEMAIAPKEAKLSTNVQEDTTPPTTTTPSIKQIKDITIPEVSDDMPFHTPVEVDLIGNLIIQYYFLWCLNMFLACIFLTYSILHMFNKISDYYKKYKSAIWP